MKERPHRDPAPSPFAAAQAKGGEMTLAEDERVFNLRLRPERLTSLCRALSDSSRLCARIVLAAILLL